LRDQLFPSGTLGLRVLHTPSKPIVDIIFVHGLTGNSYGTWLEERSETYWPVGLLREDVQNARIMTYGYDADVIKLRGQVSDNNLRGYSTSLLEDLSATRSRDKSVRLSFVQNALCSLCYQEKRKIIFIVHSLGGLLLKKALCISEGSSHEHLKELDRCTIGIIFLGTPHRGSDIASLPDMALKALRAFGKQSNRDLTPLFDRNSTELENISRDFAEWVNKNRGRFNAMCFYEELGMEGIGKVRQYPDLCSNLPGCTANNSYVLKVVSKESARIDGYPDSTIHANHKVRRSISRCFACCYH
jgi:hypothetical protein